MFSLAELQTTRSRNPLVFVADRGDHQEENQDKPNSRSTSSLVTFNVKPPATMSAGYAN